MSPQGDAPERRPSPTVRRCEQGRSRLQSYTRLFASCAQIQRPANPAEVKACLAAASEAGRRVTIRAGGHSFDAQSLGDDLVVSLERLVWIRPSCDDRHRTWVTVGAGTTWGAILQELAKEGLVPAVMVTSSKATAGGTLSGDCLSRFSSLFGREGNWVESFTMMTMDGDELLCSRYSASDLAREAFYGAIAGLGYLGVVTEITYRVIRVWKPPIAVRSRMEKHETYETVARALAGTAAQTFAGVGVVGVAASDVTVTDGLPEAPWATIIRRETTRSRVRRRLTNSTAVSSPEPGPLAWLLGEPVKQSALVFASSYEHTRRRKRPPQRWFGFLVWWIARCALITNLLWPTTYKLLPRQGTYYESVWTFTFFMNGHMWAKRIGGWFRLPMRTVQQTFVVPLGDVNTARHLAIERERINDTLKEWLDAASIVFEQHGLAPTLQDIEFINDTERFLLSANAGVRGFAVSYAFETSNKKKIERVQDAFSELSDVLHCMFGGRVYLVKNVFAGEQTLTNMYSPNVEAFFTLKSSLDPQGLLCNGFLMETFGTLYRGTFPDAGEPAGGPAA